MKCPRCAGLLIQEEIQEHSGRFHGWRCIQCGFRLDQTIAQHRLVAQAEEDSSKSEDFPANCSDNLRSEAPSRLKRQAGRA
ncbi:MAG: hypothetical protein HY581_04965 [Nitrospirae bacterium]|nr:hypothetical protein [Nitrospirota bacterium]